MALVEFRHRRNTCQEWRKCVENSIWFPTGPRGDYGFRTTHNQGEPSITAAVNYPSNSDFQESPRWLASVGRNREAIENLAFFRKDSINSEDIIREMAEIEAAVSEEREARLSLGLKEVFFGKGNFIRFVIAFVIFFLQQWTGQNSVKYVRSGNANILTFIL